MNKRKRMAVRKHRVTARKWKQRQTTTTMKVIPFTRSAPTIAAGPVPSPVLTEPKPAPRRAPRRARPAAAPEAAAAALSESEPSAES